LLLPFIRFASSPGEIASSSSDKISRASAAGDAGRDGSFDFGGNGLVDVSFSYIHTIYIHILMFMRYKSSAYFYFIVVAGRLKNS
jgi:hypothetical protein